MIYRDSTMIGNIVKAIVGRPLGSCHPKHKGIYYAVNYGGAPEDASFTKEEIMAQTAFQEQYFQIEILM